MAINFPNSPSNGATYTYQGIKYTYKDTGSGNGYWYLKDLGTSTEATTEDIDTGTISNKFISPNSLSGSKYDKTYSSAFNSNNSGTIATSKAVHDGVISAINSSITPTGSVIAFAGSTIPSGWLLCDGSTISSGYTALRSMVGNATPDLRGQFIRGMYSGRSLRSKQLNAMQRVQGTVSGISETYSSASGSASGAFAKAGSVVGSLTPSNTDNSLAGSFTFDNARVANTASETRPDNMALYYIIKT